MRRSTILTVSMAAFAAFSLSAAAPPSIGFRSKGVTVGGLRPGTRIVWLAMLRDRVTQRPRVTILRGLEPVKPNGEFAIDGDRDVSYSVWIVAAIDEEIVLKSPAPGFPTSTDPIEIAATDRSNAISVRANSIHLTYVRRHGAGAWSFAAADGSELDADGVQNGWIVVPLKSLQRLKGSPNPPDMVSAGDLILAIDAIELRSAAVEVRK